MDAIQKKKLELARAKLTKQAFKLPLYDVVTVDRPEQNIEVCTYFLAEKIVAIATITYSDNSRSDINSVEWQYNV